MNSEVEQNVDRELAAENLESIKEKICEAGSAVSGFRPDVVFYTAELAAIRQLLVGIRACTDRQYDNLVSNNLLENLSDMVDMGIADAGLLDDEWDEEDVANPE